QGRARPLREQSTDVAVAALGDAPEPGLATGAVLSRHQSRPCRQLPPVAVVGRVADRRDHGAGGQGPDAGELLDALGSVAGPGVGTDPGIALVDPQIEL